jgi:alanyl-tRNA synthetase
MESLKPSFQEYHQDIEVPVVESIKSSFLEFHQDRGFTIHDSFPLVIDDPTVLFTNATITPFKPMFSGDMDSSNYALIQKCLRLGGTGGTADTARVDINYTSLFNMLGSGLFNVSHDDALKYFVDMLGALGLNKNNLIFSTIEGHPLESSLRSASLDANQVRIIEDPKALKHDWSFGEGDLHGRGVIAWHASEGYIQNPDLSDCLQIGRIVDIDGISKGTSVIPFEHTAFDVGLGLSRVELALTGKNEVTMKQWRILSEQLKNSLDGISEGDAHYMANLCRVIDELTLEGLMPGNKKHSYVLRKIVRSLIEETWLHSEGFVDVESVLQFFIEGSMSKSRVAAAISDEQTSLRRILSEVESRRKKHPEMTVSELYSTFGIRPNLFSLM